MNPNLQILSSESIDRSRWDGCIHKSYNPLIYGTSVYLDYMSANWHGIILNDYEAVMPLMWKQKFGIRYTYHVPFLPQAGWYSKYDINDPSVFTTCLFKFCRYGDYNFNYANTVKDARVISATNLILNLSASYSELTTNFNKDVLYILRKPHMQKLVYAECDIQTAINLYKLLYSQKFPHVSHQDYKNFNRLCSHLNESNSVVARKVTDADKDILAVSLLLKDQKRLYNIINAVTETGRKAEANYYLYNAVFKEFAGSKYIFDFEGSDISGVKAFYKKFGAEDQPYQTIHFNLLPFPINLLKP